MVLKSVHSSVPAKNPYLAIECMCERTMNTVKANTVILTEGDLSKGGKKKKKRKKKKISVCIYFVSLSPLQMKPRLGPACI